MSEERTYFDVDGNKCTLEVLCRREPEWASNMIRDLRWRIVANAGRTSGMPRSRWAHVMAATGFGSTEAARLCRDAGFDPDEMVGGETNGEERGGDDEAP